MVIESTFWMAPTDRPAGLKTRLSEAFHKRILRRCVRTAEARIFTQGWYRDLLLPGTTERSLIAPAAWIDEEKIRPDVAEPRSPGPTRLIYPTRLISEKGVATVLEAARRLAERADVSSLVLDIIGEGPMKDAVLEAAACLPDGPVRLRYLDPVPYGAPFFELLRGYDGVLIANRTEEQPRIAFDAFSQGLPCVASRTHGNGSVIEDGRTGLFFPPGDAPALAELLIRLAADTAPLATMRDAALATARTQTHQGMHRRREVFLRDVLEPSQISRRE